MSQPAGHRIALLAGIAVTLLTVSVGLVPSIEAVKNWIRRGAQERAARDFEPYSRYYDLTLEVRDAVRSSPLTTVCAVEDKGWRLLGLAHSRSLPGDFWNRGNAIHYGNLLLGRCALSKGDVPGARERLLCASDSPSSPQLGDYGPDMTLAEELLTRGEGEVVLQYIQRCQAIWLNSKRSRLNEWYDAIRIGEHPDFGSRSGLQGQGQTSHSRQGPPNPALQRTRFARR